jgi:hypothetical protein
MCERFNEFQWNLERTSSGAELGWYILVDAAASHTCFYQFTNVYILQHLCVECVQLMTVTSMQANVAMSTMLLAFIIMGTMFVLCCTVGNTPDCKYTDQFIVIGLHIRLLQSH